MKHVYRTTLVHPATGNFHYYFTFTDKKLNSNAQLDDKFNNNGVYKHLKLYTHEYEGTRDKREFLKSCEPEYKGSRWTADDITTLVTLLHEKRSIGVMSCILNRTTGAVLSKIVDLMDNMQVRSCVNSSVYYSNEVSRFSHNLRRWIDSGRA